MPDSQLQMLGTLILMGDTIIDRPPRMRVDFVELKALRSMLCKARDNNDPYAGRIRDEAVMVAQALINVICAREDKQLDVAARWTAIAAALLPFVRTDLAVYRARDTYEKEHSRGPRN